MNQPFNIIIESLLILPPTVIQICLYLSLMQTRSVHVTNSVRCYTKLSSQAANISISNDGILAGLTL
jgi:hypothetical protein